MAPPVFPVLSGLGYPVKRTPVWSTQHQEAVSGRDNALQLWTYPRWRYQLTYDFLRNKGATTEIQTLSGFFNQVGGAAGVFQFNDTDDGTATAAQFGIGNASAQTFQLTRTWGGFVEPVWYPTTITSVSINGSPTADYSIGTNPGQIIFNSPPALSATLTWTGAFNWLCRFDDDTSDFEKFMYWLWEAKQIKFTTIKFP